jgi:hypothetical protein
MPSLASGNRHVKVSRFILCGRAELVLRAWIGNSVLARSRAARVAACVFCVVRVVIFLILGLHMSDTILEPFGAITIESMFSGPHQSSRQDFLLHTASHERSIEQRRLIVFPILTFLFVPGHGSGKLGPPNGLLQI